MLRFLIEILIRSLNEVLKIHFGQGAAELWVPKVCARRVSNPGRSESSDSLNKLAKNVASNPKGLEIILTANFEGL